jgi:glucose/arabinose dehydrogenase
MRRRTLFTLAGSALSSGLLGSGALAGGCDSGGGQASPAGSTSGSTDGSPGGPASSAGTSTPTVIATGLNVPWGVAFLPDRTALVNERETGRVLRIPAGGGTPTQVMRLADVSAADSGEGGLLGLAVSPAYRDDGWVFAYYSTRTDNRIVRFRLGGAGQPILTGLRRGIVHNGGRIAFGPDGKLYAGVGETGDRSLAQNLGTRNGKILRINPDGSVPGDNPFAGSPVWSYGHRNVQGLAWDRSGQLWATEFGQDRFDEVNLIQRGHNYGWPTVEGTGDTRNGTFTNPAATWTTSEASPSGAAIIGDTMYIGALRGESVLRLTLNGTRATKDSPLLAGAYGRIRTVVAAPDGTLWVTTSNRDGRGKPAAQDDRILAVSG